MPSGHVIVVAVIAAVAHVGSASQSLLQPTPVMLPCASTTHLRRRGRWWSGVKHRRPRSTRPPSPAVDGAGRRSRAAPRRLAGHHGRRRRLGAVVLAAVAVDLVAVVALLAGVDVPVAAADAGRLVLAGRGTAVAALGVAVVACCSPGSTVPSPQTWRRPRRGLRRQGSRFWQVAEQPSPLTVLPSSHCSPFSTVPLPQTARRRLLLAGRRAAVAALRSLPSSALLAGLDLSVAADGPGVRSCTSTNSRRRSSCCRRRGSRPWPQRSSLCGMPSSPASLARAASCSSRRLVGAAGR